MLSVCISSEEKTPDGQVGTDRIDGHIEVMPEERDTISVNPHDTLFTFIFDITTICFLFMKTQVTYC